jgi:hypothetical protein
VIGLLQRGVFKSGPSAFVLVQRHYHFTFLHLMSLMVYLGGVTESNGLQPKIWAGVLLEMLYNFLI